LEQPVVIRRIIATAAVAFVATACLGAAATLAVTSDRVSAGSASSDVSCSTGTTVTYSYGGANVTSVLVTNLPAACHGGRVWIALRDTAGTLVSQAGPVVASGGSATLDVPDVDAALVQQYAIAVVT
jgi:hypothetical protein